VHEPSVTDLQRRPLQALLEIISELRVAGLKPVVIDSDDLLRQPEAMLRSLCAGLGLAWDAAMLSWCGKG
jgi:hypothetical protein